jgi:hypothetical protein
LFGLNLKNADIGMENFGSDDRGDVERLSFRVKEHNSRIRLYRRQIADNVSGSYKMRIADGEASTKDLAFYAIIFLLLLLDTANGQREGMIREFALCQTSAPFC